MRRVASLVVLLLAWAPVAHGGVTVTNDRTEIATIYDILREGESARFHQAVSYPARAQHAVRSALDAMRRAAVAEQYELMKGQPS